MDKCQLLYKRFLHDRNCCVSGLCVSVATKREMMCRDTKMESTGGVVGGEGGLQAPGDATSHIIT